MPPLRPVSSAPDWLVPLICLIFASALLGISTNLAKAAGEAGLNPLAFLAWSSTGAAGLLIGVSIRRGRPPPLNWRTIRYYLYSAFLSVAGANLVLFSAIPHVGAGFAALIITLPPLLTYIGAVGFRLEHFRAVRALGVAAALAGAAVLAARKMAAPDAEVFWILFALLSPLLFGIGNVYRSLHWPAGASADSLAPGMLAGASVLLFPAAMLPGFDLHVPLDHALPLALILMQALVFAGQFFLVFIVQERGGAVMLSLIGPLAAVVGVPVAIFLQGEALPPGLLPGAGLIALGVALVTSGQTRSR